MRPHLRWLLSCSLAWVVAPAALAAPLLEIRARSELQIRADRDEGEATRIRLELRDDVGASVPYARLSAQAQREGVRCGSRTNCITRRDGSCEVRVVGCEADEIVATFEGNGTLDPVERIGRVRGAGGSFGLSMALEGGTRIDLDGPDVRITLRRDAVGVGDAQVRFSDELGRTILARALATTDEATVTIPARDLGPPGIGALVAEVTDPDGTRASARTMLVRQRRTTLTLTRERTPTPGLVATLRDPGGPVPRAVIALECDGRRQADAVTDASGRTRFVPPDDAEPHSCRATYYPNSPGRTSARSGEVRLAARGASPTAGLLPWASLALAIVAVIVATRRAHAPSDAPAPRAAPKATVERSAAEQLLPSRTDVGFEILAAEDDRPLAAARLVMADGSELTAGDDGVVRADLRGRSIVALTFVCDGRAPETVRVRIPHRGEWSRTRVRLETTRAHARRAIDVVARAAAKDEDEAAAMTLREAEARLARTSDAEFPDHAETHVYGVTAPTIDEARGLVARGRSRAASPGESPTKDDTT